MERARANIWERLTGPAPAIKDLGQRRQAQLLAGVLLLIIILGTLSGVIQLLTVPGFVTTFRIIGGGIGVLLVAYAFARTRYFLIGATISALVPLVVVSANAVANPDDTIAFAFLVIGVLLGSIFLPWRWLVLLILGHVLALALWPLVTPALIFTTVVGPLFFLMISSGLVMLAFYHRDQVERDRRKELAQANALLQQEINERKQAEEDRKRLLRETQAQAQQLSHILAAVQEGIVLLDATGRVLVANPVGGRYLTLLGPPTADNVLTELGGQPLVDLLADGQGDRLRHELTLTEPSLIFELLPTPMQVGPHAGGWVLILRDISEEKARQTYHQAQERLATVGQLAAGVSHDLNNIMAVVTLYSQLVLQKSDLSPRSREQLVTVREQAARAANLINQILDFSRNSVMDRAVINLVSFVKELMQLMERMLPENITLMLDYDRRDLSARVDPTRLQQVLMNLIVNARDAMPDGGRLRLGLTGYGHQEGMRPPLPDLPAGDWVRITVTDSGTGITAQVLPHVFEPFFTTKAVGVGTGLGLAQAYGIVKQHGGYIDIMSRVNQGTTVTIFLPEVLPAELKSAPVTPAVLGAGERILVVEDDSTTRLAVHDILTSLGYNVLTAANGGAALTLLADQSTKIALVLSDVIMPGMGGEALLGHIREQGLKTPVVFMTGYPLADTSEALLDDGLVAWLAKPFTAEEVSNVVHQALNSA